MNQLSIARLLPSPRLAAFQQMVKPYWPLIRAALMALAFLLVMSLLGHASAQATIDGLAGTKVTGNGTSLIKTFETSLLLKIICGGIIIIGGLTWAITKRTGSGAVAGGAVAYLMLSNLTGLLSIVGITL